MPLFIGGSKNGKWIDTDDLCVEVNTLTELELIPVDNPFKGVKRNTVEQYTRRRLTGETENFVVYALRDINSDTLIELLINGYSN